jgi:hypothetical protein
VTAGFVERLSGVVHDLEQVPYRTGERDARQGHGLRDSALDAAASDAPAREIEISGLDVLVEIWPDAKDGHGSWVTGGTVVGTGPRPASVVAGYVDLLFLSTAGVRRTYHRLLTADDPDPDVATVRLIECVREVGPDRRSLWADTTTTYARVSRLPAGVLIAAELDTTEGLAATRRAMDGVMTGLSLESEGVLRVTPPGMARQLTSLTGRGWPLTVGTARRLAFRSAR